MLGIKIGHHCRALCSWSRASLDGLERWRGRSKREGTQEAVLNSYLLSIRSPGCPDHKDVCPHLCWCIIRGVCLGETDELGLGKD